MSIARSLLLILPLTLASLAHATVYKCVDADGRVTYTNDRTSAGECTPLTTDLPVSSVPAPSRAPGAQPPAPAPGFPRVSPDTQQSRDDTRRQILETELAEEEAALREARAKLQEEEQRDAPEDRNIVRRTEDGRTYRSINVEKREERLRPFRSEVELHERNVEALRRELRGLR